MRVAPSLTNRIFLASTLLATLSLGFAFYFVNARVSAEAEAELRRGLTEAATLVEVRRENLTEMFTTLARLIADLPVVKASVETGDPPTVQPLADRYRQEMQADLFVLTDPAGRILGVSGGEASALPMLGEALASTEEISAFLPHPRGVLHVLSVPILLGLDDPVQILGRLTVGFFMDDRLAARFKELTGSEIAFATDGAILASSMARDARVPLASVIHTTGIASVTLPDGEYLALARSMAGTGGGTADAEHRPVTLVLRSRSERLRFLNTLRAGLAGALIVTVMLATILSYAVARTMTRPLNAVTSAMRHVAATGDLTRRVSLRSRAWDDEDARLLATAFNTLTESIGRFQREAAQRERLSSLGRMSTVIAHEIRNPLMIIRASLATLRDDRVTATERGEAVADIDDETTRLNRIVTEVLDFAKPIRFDLAEADLNDICRDSAAAAWAGSSDGDVRLDLDAQLPLVVTDSERLRTALVNLVANARQAVEAAPAGTGPGVIVSTRQRGNRVIVTVRDRGIGIAAEDMAHIFDPYFTTRRAGTGLGLPIAKNVVEGLGGTVAVSSRPGDGTEIRIELPLTPEAAA